MTIFYKNGFFNDENGGFVPEGAVRITKEFYIDLITGQSKGHLILADEQGYPFLAPLQPTPYHEWNGKEWTISKAHQAEFIAKRKAELMTRIAQKTDKFKTDYLVGYSQAEIDSFYRQEREARGELPLMLLTELFEGRDDLHSVEELKKKVIEKADIFAIIMGKLFAIKQNFEKHIEAAQTEQELEQIAQEIEAWQKI